MGHAVRYEGPEKLVWRGRPVSLKRAVANLVENAVRYGGSATVGLAAGEEATITVADEGPGIPADRLEDVFEPFVRLETSRSRETGGVGLGLVRCGPGGARLVRLGLGLGLGRRGLDRRAARPGAAGGCIGRRRGRKQILLDLRNLGRRPVRTALTALGLALVVFLLLLVVGFVRGLELSLQQSGDPEVVLLHNANAAENLEKVVAGVLRTMAEVGRTAGVTLTSFEPYALEVAMRLAPDQPRGFIGAWTDEESFAIAERYAVSRAAINLDHATPEIVARARAAGYYTVGWPCNSPEAAERVRACGFDAVCTDMPSTIAPLFGRQVGAPTP